MKKPLIEVTVKNIIFKVGNEVKLKECEGIGVIKEIQYSGHFEEYKKYDLMIHWLDDSITIRTPTEYFFEVMEFF